MKSASRLLALFTALSAADLTATWNGTTGNWTDFARWSTNPDFPNNGANTFDAVQSAGTVTVNQDITIEKYNLAGGANTGSGFTLTLNDVITFGAGTLNGTGSLAANGGVAFSGTGFKDINSGRVLNLGGNSTWSAGQIRTGGGIVINNQAGSTFDTSFDGDMNATLGGSATFNNAGTFTKSAGAGTTTISSGVAFNNTGTVNVNSGTLQFSGAFTQTAGQLVLNGGNVTKSGGTFAINGGSIEGTGTLSGSAAVTAATLAPGFSAGSLAFTGDLTVTSATIFDIELGGFVQGVGYDFISEAGGVAFNLNGSTLNISFLPGFALLVNPSDTFSIVTSNQSIAGSFSNVASGGTLVLPEGTFTVTYAGQNSVTLSNFTAAAIPEPSTYAVLAGLGVLALASARRRRALRPTAA